MSAPTGPIELLPVVVFPTPEVTGALAAAADVRVNEWVSAADAARAPLATQQQNASMVTATSNVLGYEAGQVSLRTNTLEFSPFLLALELMLGAQAPGAVLAVSRPNHPGIPAPDNPLRTLWAEVDHFFAQWLIAMQNWVWQYLAFL